VVAGPPLGPNPGVRRGIEILEILKVFTTMGIGFAGTSGFNLAPALALNPIGAPATTFCVFLRKSPFGTVQRSLRCREQKNYSELFGYINRGRLELEHD